MAAPSLRDSASYLAAQATMLAGVGTLVTRSAGVSIIVAIIIVAIARGVFKLDTPTEDDCLSPRFLRQGHQLLLAAHLLCWPTVIAMYLLRGEIPSGVLLVINMVLLPVGVLGYVAGLSMIEYSRAKENKSR